MRVKCPKCGYEWDYRGRRNAVTCPNCLHKFIPTTTTSHGVIVATSPRGDRVFGIPIENISKINQKELWEKTGAKVVESSKDDKIVIVDVPDGKADEISEKFNQLLNKKLEELGGRKKNM